MTSTDLQRHTLVTLDRRGWSELFAARPDLDDYPALAEWPTRDWPLMARRPDDTVNRGRLALGIPLPPSCGKVRIAVHVDRASVVTIAAPPTLASVKSTAPAHWQPTINALLRLAASLDCTPRVFGSFAWQALTDLDYITPESDLDLLWPLSPRIDELLTRLPALEAEAPGLIDGEIVGDGAAVNWRELARSSAEVLLKTIHGVLVMPRAEFLARAAPA